MSRSLVVASLLVLGLGTPALAADDSSPAATPNLLQAPAGDWYQHDHQGIGIYVSNLAGAGITYRHRFTSGWGFHVSAVGYDAPGSAPFATAGLAVTREFSRVYQSSLYGFLATGFGYGDIWGGFAPNVAPGIGIDVGPFYGEVGYSLYSNSGGPGFVPAFGAGWSWDF